MQKFNWISIIQLIAKILGLIGAGAAGGLAIDMVNK